MASFLLHYRSFAMLLLVVPVLLSGSLSGLQAGDAADPVKVLLTGLDDARSVRISTLGNLFIVETGRNRILKTDRYGIRVDSVGRLGNGAYQFDLPVAIDPANELKIYVADKNNRRIQVFDRRLQYLSTLQMPRRTGLPVRYLPSRVEVDPSGNIFFLDADRHVIYRFDSNGQYELDFELFGEDGRILPAAMTLLDDELWVAGERGQLLHRFTLHGSYRGFVHSPEPVRSLRTSGGALWMLGTRHAIMIDTGGKPVRSLPLPDVPAGRGQHSGQLAAEGNWQTFDIRDNHVYLLNRSTLVRVALTE